MRERVLPDLEKARQAKLIGKSLEARAVLKVADVPADLVAGWQESLRELLNVSQLEVLAGGVAAGQDPVVEITRAEGAKCDRCWHWESDVGRVAEHATLCGRCVEAVTSWQKLKG